MATNSPLYTMDKAQVAARLAEIRKADAEGYLRANDSRDALTQLLFRGVMLGMTKFELYPDAYGNDATGQNKGKNTV